MSLLVLAFLILSTIIMMPGCSGDETSETVPQIKQQAYLKASTTGAGDWFGTNIAVDGDTLVVGARFEDSAATGAPLQSTSVYFYPSTREQS